MVVVEKHFDLVSDGRRMADLLRLESLLDVGQIQVVRVTYSGIWGLTGCSTSGFELGSQGEIISSSSSLTAT